MFQLLLVLATLAQCPAKVYPAPAVIKRHAFQQLEAKDVIIINTLDGCIHGIKKSNGKLLWSRLIKEGSMIKVEDTSHQPGPSDNDYDGETSISEPLHQSKVIFIPEPAGDGDLYYVEPGQKMKKFDVSLKDMVDRNLGVRDSKHLFTGGKKTQVVALDPLLGTVVRTFGEDGPSDCQDSTKDAIFLGRTEYLLNIWDIESDKLMWNISYVEYLPTTSSMQPPSSFGTLKGDINGKFLMCEHDKGLFC